MRYLMTIALLCLGAATAFGQNKKSKAPAPEQNFDLVAVDDATNALAEKYALSPVQVIDMKKIQERKFRNMSEIKGYKISKPDLYRAKLASVQKGTLASIRRLLKTEEQLARYQQTQLDVRTRREEKRRELQEAKASREEIELALLAIYAE